MKSQAALVVALLAVSCGGRSLSSPHGDAAAVQTGEAGATGGAGTTGAAGASNAAGTTGAAGATTGAAGATTGAAGAHTGAAGATTGAAGVTGAAGTAGAAGVTGAAGTGAACGPCPPATCKPGFKSVVIPDISCCAICARIDCTLQDCGAPPTCPAGQHLELRDGDCCQTCQPGTESSACTKGREGYTQSRTVLVEKYNFSGCKVDSDCALVFENNACVSNCGTAFPKGLADQAQSNLDSLAASDCAMCPKPVIPPCVPLVAVCSNGQCVAASGPSR
jgi:hypothetical protein